MAAVFKQTYNSFNLEFDDYLEVLFSAGEPGFLGEVQAFGRELMSHVLKIRVTQSDIRDFNEEVLANGSRGAVLTVGRLVLMTAKKLKQPIDERLTDDFPKFIGTKTNFWRYLLRLVPVFISEMSADYTREFAVATACLLELNFFCFRVGQLNLVDNSRSFWTAMFLHFFGERFRGRDKSAFLNDFNLEEVRKISAKSEVESLKVVVKVEVQREAKTDEENKIKKSRKKNKKRHK